MNIFFEIRQKDNKYYCAFKDDFYYVGGHILHTGYYLNTSFDTYNECVTYYWKNIIKAEQWLGVLNHLRQWIYNLIYDKHGLNDDIRLILKNIQIDLDYSNWFKK